MVRLSFMTSICNIMNPGRPRSGFNLSSREWRPASTGRLEKVGQGKEAKSCRGMLRLQQRQ